MQSVAVRHLLCVSRENARQRLCRAFLAICRAPEHTVKALFPVVMCYEQDNGIKHLYIKQSNVGIQGKQ
jgi:hypothetical protein